LPPSSVLASSSSSSSPSCAERSLEFLSSIQFEASPTSVSPIDG
jgi:hypothetical protein